MSALQEFKTIKTNGEFKRAYARGKSFANPALATYAIKNRSNTSQIGITASKKVGNAVQRNRARRIIRAAFRELSDEVNTGFDLVFVARTKTVNSKSTQIKEIMKKHLKAAGAMK